MVRIGVVLGSIRPGRLDKAVAEWTVRGNGVTQVTGVSLSW
jgi:hypothetical protein